MSLDINLAKFLFISVVYVVSHSASWLYMALYPLQDLSKVTAFRIIHVRFF